MENLHEIYIFNNVPNGDKYFVNEMDPFIVQCYFDRHEICLLFDELDDDFVSKQLMGIKAGRNEFLINTANPFNVTSLYGVNYRQLRWFQSQAKSYIRQVIRFHCKNVVVKHSNETQNVQLLSWNQKYIDLNGTVDASLIYDILSERDECAEFEHTTGTSPKYNEIKIEGFPEYLPITGVVIQNNMPAIEEQAFLLEAIELCADF